jgi:ubiquinone/menaquinone biosynthesis C-methylase UbiE
MAWYDVFSSFYDAALEPLYAEHRVLAADALALEAGMSVLDVPCGTGQSFPALAARLGNHGTIIAADASAGMLRRATERVPRTPGVTISTVHARADALERTQLQAQLSGREHVDRLHVFLGMSVFLDMQASFDRLWSLLAPGGRAVLVDVHAAQLGLQGRAVNLIAGADIRRRFWEPLEARANNFALRDLPFNARHGGQIKLAVGDKPA